jgi:hypothetical protein
MGLWNRCSLLVQWKVLVTEVLDALLESVLLFNVCTGGWSGVDEEMGNALDNVEDVLVLLVGKR